jgi:hypothetical protein
MEDSGFGANANQDEYVTGIVPQTAERINQNTVQHIFPKIKPPKLPSQKFFEYPDAQQVQQALPEKPETRDAQQVHQALPEKPETRDAEQVHQALPETRAIQTDAFVDSAVEVERDGLEENREAVIAALVSFE